VLLGTGQHMGSVAVQYTDSACPHTRGWQCLPQRRQLAGARQRSRGESYSGGHVGAVGPDKANNTVARDTRTQHRDVGDTAERQQRVRRENLISSHRHGQSRESVDR